MALRCITHLLPLSSKNRIILELISNKGVQQAWNLDGWNDHIIQPARDAAFNYYQVCTAKISSVQFWRSNPFNKTLFIPSAMQNHMKSVITYS